MDPERWLTDYNKRLAGTAASAQAASDQLGQISGQARSGRGEVEVRVSAAGALDDLRLTPAARRLEADQLAQLILATARAAQRDASEQAVRIMTDYVGEGPALDAFTQYLPGSEVVQ